MGRILGRGDVSAVASHAQANRARATDALFVATVAGATVLAHRAWSRGNGWTWYWLAAAAATLTKGPLGIALSGAGLLAVVWEKRAGTPAPLRGSHRLGIGLFLALAGGWFALACLFGGHDVWDKLVRSELVGQAVDVGDQAETGTKGFPGASFYKPPFYFLTRFAPWSLLTILGLWRVFRTPASDESERRLERFLACSLVVGLVLFSIATHTRPGLVSPLMPAAALLAGREAARLWRPRRPWAWCGIAVAIACLVALEGVYHGRAAAKDERVLQTLAIRSFAGEVRSRVPSDTTLVFVDVPYTLQFYLGLMRPVTTYDQAATMLAESRDVAVLVTDPDRLRKRLAPGGPGLTELVRCPEPARAVLVVPTRTPDSAMR